MKSKVKKDWKKHKHGSKGGAIYGLGVIGALIYFFQNAHTFADVLVGIIKAVGWPAVIIYRVLQLLNL